mgnify:CR=1 FL=1
MGDRARELVVALVVAIIIKTFLVQAFFIPSASMAETLVEGDRVMVNKLASALGPVLTPARDFTDDSRSGEMSATSDSDRGEPSSTTATRRVALRWDFIFSFPSSSLRDTYVKCRY